MAEGVYISRKRDFVSIAREDYGAAVTPEWFDPDAWGAAAKPVTSGGRGGAWFVETEDMSAVLRKYLRGGFVARFSESNYLYLGEKRVRSFAEFRLLLKMHDEGFPVPRPIAASYRKTAIACYQGVILIERLKNSAPLADSIGDLSLNRWRALGETLRRFHDAGICHADLNCFNILVRDEGFYLIDFDKGEVKKKSTRAAPWKAANLARLRRSLERLNWPQEGAGDLQGRWLGLEEGYQGKTG
ncbi:3-deoxy-D-manno-octulosonic acid kinase [Marinobacter sp. F3R11]|uniref:3-deoxy-D-manno-octulosonic acid kinase n=1 Tax=Marinobacter sp. F3R11 TaxID=2267231 RepID=UPI001651532E|nr:3-deoxy-D-manno-octulosonic acid kinase [Marinobacter sp. F3R11]